MMSRIRDALQMIMLNQLVRWLKRLLWGAIISHRIF